MSKNSLSAVCGRCHRHWQRQFERGDGCEPGGDFDMSMNY
jgi:hypothetical protein